jgi:hypothetical protein
MLLGIPLVEWERGSDQNSIIRRSLKRGWCWRDRTTGGKLRLNRVISQVVLYPPTCFVALKTGPCELPRPRSQLEE